MNKLILPTILVAVAIASFFLYTKPAYDDMQTVQAELDEYDMALDRVAQIQQIRDELLGRYNRIPEDSLYILRQILPAELDRVRFLIELNQIATRNGLTVQDASFSGGEGSSGGEDSGPQDPYESTEVTFQTSGTYGNVLGFMRDLEQSARLLDIVQLSVGGDSDSGSSGEESGEIAAGGSDANSYSFTVVAYWLPDDTSERDQTERETEEGMMSNDAI